MDITARMPVTIHYKYLINNIEPDTKKSLNVDDINNLVLIKGILLISND